MFWKNKCEGVGNGKEKTCPFLFFAFNEFNPLISYLISVLLSKHLINGRKKKLKLSNYHLKLYFLFWEKNWSLFDFFNMFYLYPFCSWHMWIVYFLTSSFLHLTHANYILSEFLYLTHIPGSVLNIMLKYPHFVSIHHHHTLSYFKNY